MIEMTTREKENLERAVKHIEERRGDYQNPDTLISILKYSELKLIKREGSGGREWGTSLDQAYLYVNALFYNEAEENIDDIDSALEKSYMIGDGTYSLGININLKMGQIEPIDGPDEIDVSFKDIKEKIIEGIRGAKYVIFAAVAWITDNDIVNELIKKREEGIGIRVIISESKYSEKVFEKLEQNSIGCKVIPPFGNEKKNMMHNKFCIIDLKYVINGSYNWTNAAKYHNENIVITDSYVIATKYADEFMKLYSKTS